MASKNRIGNRVLESCVGTKTAPRGRQYTTIGVCHACGKVLRLRKDGLLPTHGRMLGAIWCPSKQEFTYR